jgi:voltage-gated potassium channel
LLVMVLFTGIRAVSDTRKKLYVALATSLPAIALQLARYINESEIIYLGSQIMMLIFFVFSALVLFKHILNTSEVTHDEIFGAVSVYMFCALSFTSMYLLIDRWQVGSFEKTVGGISQKLNYSDYLYYSFGTITTSGSGPIVEIGALAHSFSIFEAVFGVFYVAFIISKLVPAARKRR